MRSRYAAQVGLLVRAIPVVAEEEMFALKGGTAINLFYRDMPRLSVDIDLTYLPLDGRTEALANIDAAFDRMVARAGKLLPGIEAHRIAGGGGGDTRMQLQFGEAQVKIEGCRSPAGRWRSRGGCALPIRSKTNSALPRRL